MRGRQSCDIRLLNNIPFYINWLYIIATIKEFGMENLKRGV